MRMIMKKKMSVCRQNVKIVGAADPSSAAHQLRKDQYLSPGGAVRKARKQHLARSVLRDWASCDDDDDSARRHADTFLKHSLRRKRRYSRMLKDLDRMDKVFK